MKTQTWSLTRPKQRTASLFPWLPVYTRLLDWNAHSEFVFAEHVDGDERPVGLAQDAEMDSDDEDLGPMPATEGEEDTRRKKRRGKL
jgi:hypothetical protein